MAVPKWQDYYKTWQAEHQARFGQDMNRPWTADADAAAAKKAIDDVYLKGLAEYNAANGTSEKPDASVLGVNVQPNTFTPTDHSNDGFFGGLAKSLGMTTDQFGTLAALAGGGYGLYASGLLGGGAAAAGGAETATGAGGALGVTGTELGALGAEGLGGVGAEVGGLGAFPSAIGTETGFGGGFGSAGAGGGLDSLGAIGSTAGYGGITGSLLPTGSAASSGLSSLLKDNKGLAQLGGGLLGALAGKDTTTSATSSKDPWGPAQSYLKDNLATNAAMQKYYQANPFSNEQKSAYQGQADAYANNMANMPAMQANANNFMQSKRGSMPAMQGLLSGTKAAPIDWAKYVIGKA